MKRTTALAVVAPEKLSALVEADVADACRDSRAPRTRILYARAWKRFATWCGRRRPLPAAPETVAGYITARYRDGAARNSLALELTAISQAHIEAGHDSPRDSKLVRRTWNGVQRWYARDGRAGVRKAAPLTVELLRDALRAMPATTAGRRDAALLAVLFCGALRRSELCALQVEHVRLEDGGAWLFLPMRKTDQAGKGTTIFLPAGKSAAACPVAAVRAWLACSSIVAGPLFRRVRRGGVVGQRALEPGTVARIVKAHARALGLDESTFSGHSGRAGYVTSAADQGAPMPAVALVTGHRSLQVLAGYYRASDARRQTPRVL